MKKLLTLSLCLLLSACVAQTPSDEHENKEEHENTEEHESVALDEYDQQLSTMTLREKVGQLFIIRPDALRLEQSQGDISNPNIEGLTSLDQTAIDAYNEYPVGGFALFTKNILNPEQVKQFNDELQTLSSIKQFIAIDEEGGSIARLANHQNFDLPTYQVDRSDINSSDDAYNMGLTIGQYLKDYGFNLDFAPIADVNTNPDNPVIGDRAFSDDPNIVMEYASAMAKGLHEQGILSTFKHFPGHGDTAEDSHYDTAYTNKTKEELEQCEWIPFAKASDLVMVGHIIAPNVTDDKQPAVFSPYMVTGILKNQLGFKGLIITDSLAMQAVTDHYSPEEAAIKAIEAGCDILLMPNGLQEAFDGVVAAVESSRISEERINQIVKKILKVKADIQ